MRESTLTPDRAGRCARCGGALMVRVSYDKSAKSGRTSDGFVYCTNSTCAYMHQPHPTKDFVNRGPKT